MGETAEILRGMWAAETPHGIQGTEKHQEIQIKKISTVQRVDIVHGVHGSNSTQDIQKGQTVHNTVYRALKH
jgi:hypothetical protein